MTLAHVRGEVGHRVGGRKVEAAEVERITRRGVVQTIGGIRERLVQIERVQRAAAGVPAEHDAVVALAYRPMPAATSSNTTSWSRVASLLSHRLFSQNTA